MDLISDFLFSDLDFLLGLNEQKIVTPPRTSISEYISSVRIMPPNSPFPGYYDPKITPYMIEPMDNMSPASPVPHTTLMKGVQIGATSGLAEPAIAFYIGEAPADILFVSATTDNLKKWSIKKLEPLIDSCGLRGLIQGQTENVRSRRSGDTLLMKEFVGGTLLMGSAQSPTNLRQDSVMVLLRDEIDGAPAQLTTGEGNWLAVSEARTFAFGNRAKIADMSTPTTVEDSNIYRLYLEGDRRKFHVPCIHCDHYQEIEWGSDDTTWGIKPIVKDNKVVDVVYVCKKCYGHMRNTDKNYMLPKGRWIPTATSKKPYHRSYHLSALYSPVGMFSWSKAYEKYLEALDDPIDGMRSFVNLVLGLPYRETGARPNPNKIIGNRRSYKSWTIPDDVLFLTAGIDVQLGSTTNKYNPPRLEMEILGHGAGYRTWSIAYKVFEGDVVDPSAGAWQQLYEFYESGGFVLSRSGLVFPVQCIFVDMGADLRAATVMDFCLRGVANMYPARGFQYLKRRKYEQRDETTGRDAQRYRWAKSGEFGYYQISTVFYKNIVYSNLNITPSPTEPQKPGFCAFPMDYKDNYFRQLTAEERLEDGRAFSAGGRRNEALDCRVMALCAGHVFLDKLLAIMRKDFMSSGGTQEAAKQLSIRNVIEELELSLEKSKQTTKK